MWCSVCTVSSISNCASHPTVQTLLADSEVLLKGMLEVSLHPPCVGRPCNTLTCTLAFTYSLSNTNCLQTIYYSQKVVGCFRYLAFHQEQDLHEEALWVTECMHLASLHLKVEGWNSLPLPSLPPPIPLPAPPIPSPPLIFPFILSQCQDVCRRRWLCRPYALTGGDSR